MAVFTFQSSWLPLKGMQIHNGASFVNPKQGWVFDGSSWRLFYPEIPLNTGLPSISGTAAYQYTLTADPGTWNSNGAYAPTSFSYQWLREGATISGATSSTYTTVANDVGKNVSVRVTANNGRGSSIAVTSLSVFIVPVMTTITLTDSTVTPANPSSVTCTASTTTRLAWSSSWVNATSNRSGVIVSTGSPANGTIDAYTESTATTATGKATSSPITITVKTYNDNYQVTASWSPVLGADNYDVRLNSGSLTNQTGTSITYTTTSAAQTVTVFPKVGTITGIGGTSSSVSPTRKESSGASSPSTTLPNPTVTASSTNAYNNFSVTMTLGTDTKSVVFEYGSNIFYGSTVGTYTTNGTRSPVGPLSGGLRYWKVTPYSATGAGGIAGDPVTGTATVWTTPSIGTPSWTSTNNFVRNSTSPTNLRWFTDYPSVTGDYSSITGMEYQISTSQGTGGLLTPLNAVRAYPGAFSYPYNVQGIFWAFRMGTVDGDITYNAAARWGRVRVKVLLNDGTSGFGAWTNWI
jgi:hypothetical protein